MGKRESNRLLQIPVKANGSIAFYVKRDKSGNTRKRKNLRRWGDGNMTRKTLSADDLLTIHNQDACPGYTLTEKKKQLVVEKGVPQIYKNAYPMDINRPPVFAGTQGTGGGKEGGLEGAGRKRE